MLIISLFFIFTVVVIFGATYPVVEPDPILEIAKLTNKQVIKEQIKKARAKLLKYEAIYLPPASKNATFSFKPIYCLERDIKIPITDRGWNIKGWQTLYPKGYCFNPLDYLMVSPPRMVIFNPANKKELLYVEKIIFPKYPNALYILSGVNLKTANKIAKKSFLKKIHWYFLSSFLKKKLHLKHTISIVEVNLQNKTIDIQEISIKNLKRNDFNSNKVEE